MMVHAERDIESVKSKTPEKNMHETGTRDHDSLSVLLHDFQTVVLIFSHLDKVSNFKEQRIDGSALPLLSEDHLMSTLNMKLGPALKLRSVLASKLGNCVVCMHCVHCHSSPSPSPASTGRPNSVGRPSSTGNST
ncbi:hypothetical protein M8J76_004620 [Diaphorina citri]|nr:hypothetical protein M8J76_004620 [Diaphorina citri]